MVHPKDQMSTLSSKTISAGVWVSSGARKGAEDFVAASSSAASACYNPYKHLDCITVRKIEMNQKMSRRHRCVPFHFECRP